MVDATQDATHSGMFIEGFSQVVCIYDDGGEAVVSPCVESEIAERLASSFSTCSIGKGRRAIARPLPLACLARNLDRERQRLFGVNLRSFEAVP
jgi:hypothetical protein